MICLYMTRRTWIWTSKSKWVFLGRLEFANMDKATLLSILQLAPVALSGSYDDLNDKPNRYDSFLILDSVSAYWDYSESDKAIVTITEPTELAIAGVYNGAVGCVMVYGSELILPLNSKKPKDVFSLVDLSEGGYYQYTFLFDGTNYNWSRTVMF